MKRGLVTLEGDEHGARVEALRARLRDAGVAVGLIYGDVSRSDDIAYLTNLCVYWNEGVLAVPVDGEPAFLTRLSKRVHPWMRATSTLRDLRSGRDLAALLAEFVHGRVGLIDRAWWPAALVRGLEDAVSLDGFVREARLIPSTGEVGLLRRAGAVLGRALEEGSVAAVERRVRAAGFLDLLIAQDEVSIDATAQFRHLWVRAARTSAVAAAQRLAAATRAVRAGVTPAELAPVRCINHADLATGGDHAPGGVAPVGEATPPRHSTPLRAGEAVALVLELDGATVADTVLVGDDGAEVLTANGGGDGRVG